MDGVVAVVMSTKVRAARQVDVGVFQQEGVATLDGRQGTGGRTEFGIGIARTIVLEQYVTTQGTRLAVGTTAD